MDILSKIVFLW